VMLVIAFLVRRSSPGGALFMQTRVGRAEQPFQCYKFRTMASGAPQGGSHEVGESWITPLGRRMRAFKLDELPQLFNVMRGDMSLVGPRPVPLPHLERYDERQRRRLEVRPGLTGWAQVHGRASLPWPERLELDVWYVEHQSLSLDARILARTASVLLRRDVVYRGEVGGWR
jgi:lipopolysaccharide/colanic/teichoic acid biosynthesis glycosyltransferase